MPQHILLNGRPLCECAPIIWETWFGDLPQVCEFDLPTHAKIMAIAMVETKEDCRVQRIDGRCPV